jgi:hypothetical protein
MSFARQGSPSVTVPRIAPRGTAAPSLKIDLPNWRAAAASPPKQVRSGSSAIALTSSASQARLAAWIAILLLTKDFGAGQRRNS